MSNNTAAASHPSQAHEIRARINALALQCKLRSSSPAEAAAKQAELRAAEAELTALHMATESAAAAARVVAGSVESNKFRGLSRRWLTRKTVFAGLLGSL